MSAIAEQLSRLRCREVQRQPEDAGAICLNIAQAAYRASELKIGSGIVRSPRHYTPTLRGPNWSRR